MSLDGILLVDKPAGPTSHDAVARARSLLRAKRAGHTGTLDPFATGLLVLCLGEATKFARFAEDLHKEYEAVVRFGLRTDTLDVTGKVLDRSGAAVTRGALRDALAAMTGPIDQAPPAYSAVRVGGRRAYDRARGGEQVRLPPRKVFVYRIEPLAWEPPELRLRVCCSKGTYVRALAAELGERTGTGAVLRELRRTRVGPFDVADAVPIADARPETLRAGILPPDRLLGAYPLATLAPGALRKILWGRSVGAPDVLAHNALPGDRNARLYLADLPPPGRPPLRVIGMGTIESLDPFRIRAQRIATAP
jgi:tRNA pseudouridine55 synthase